MLLCILFKKCMCKFKNCIVYDLFIFDLFFFVCKLIYGFNYMKVNF